MNAQAVTHPVTDSAVELCGRDLESIVMFIIIYGQEPRWRYCCVDLPRTLVISVNKQFSPSEVWIDRREKRELAIRDIMVSSKNRMAQG